MPRSKILVVDDEPSILSTLRAILGAQGYETAGATSGEEAIRLACSFEPDFILSDVGMEGINGIDAVIRILEFQPQCKALFISGHAMCHDLLTQARKQGFDFEILAKPVSPVELLGKISRVLAA
jgi:CheY-like chemotaxis protein